MASSQNPPDTDIITLFKSIGLTQPKAAEAAKSPKSAVILQSLIQTYDLADKKLDEKQAVLFSALSGLLSKANSVADEGKTYIVNAILDEKLKSVDQVTAATKYVGTHPLPFDQADFNEECGIGFSISPDELHAQVVDFVASNNISSWANFSAVIAGLKGSQGLRWITPVDLKNSVEKVFTENFGEKAAAKLKAKESKDAPKSDLSIAALAESVSSAQPKKSVFEEGLLGSLHKPGENPQIFPSLREAHLAATGGLVYTRFPPEPNGYLHIGHSKAIFVNFGFAAHHGGKCYLRYDDTNPTKEERRYFESILEMVRWLGYEPWKITYSSDYFQELYDLAVELIKKDKAYVCHCSRAEIRINRGEKGGPRKSCTHRTRPIDESLAEFARMKDGNYKPEEANLRMKQDLEDGNPQMWDLTAYRVLDAEHHRTGNEWKIYPTYDFTHCLVDSFENISHSLCTTEFVASRQSYEWLCDALEVYKPRQSEYGRLNVQGTVMSKRKLLELVNGGYVSDWDDPRLYTLIALRRRGVPPGAIIQFVSGLGVSTAASNIEVARFDQTVRQYLEGTAPRLLMVLRPLKVTIDNLPEDYVLMIEKPLHPKVPQLGTTTIPFARTVYIDEDDFRLEDSKDYFRLAPGKTVGLFQAPHPITCTSFKTDPVTGKVTELICRLENEGPIKKPKAFIQWVADHAPSGSPVRIDETRIFHQLFKSDNPLAVTPDFKADINANSLETLPGTMLEIGFWELAKRSLAEARKDGQLSGKECVRFQGLRVAYFALDKEARLACLDEPEDVPPVHSQGDRLVLNRIVSLKEDVGKAI